MNAINLKSRRYEIFWKGPNTGYVAVWRTVDTRREAVELRDRVNQLPGTDMQIREVR